MLTLEMFVVCFRGLASALRFAMVLLLTSVVKRWFPECKCINGTGAVYCRCGGCTHGTGADPLLLLRDGFQYGTRLVSKLHSLGISPIKLRLHKKNTGKEDALRDGSHLHCQNIPIA